MGYGRRNHVDVMICHGYTCNLVRSNIYWYSLSHLLVESRAHSTLQQNANEIIFSSLFAAKKSDTLPLKLTMFTLRRSILKQCHLEQWRTAVLSLALSSNSKSQHCCMKSDLSWVGLGFWSNDGIQSSKSNKPHVYCVRNGIIPKRCHNVRKISRYFLCAV